VSNVTTWANAPRMSCGLNQTPWQIEPSSTSTYQNNGNQLVDDGHISDSTPKETEVGDSVQVDASVNSNVESVGDLSTLCNHNINVNDDSQIVCKVSNSSDRCNIRKKGVTY